MEFRMNFAVRLTVSFIVFVFLTSCATFPLEEMPSKNFSHRVKFLVMHYTAIDYQRSVNALVKGNSVSSHYLVPERFDPSYPHDELKVLQLVDESKRAWHAGNSFWQGRTDLNDQSIGIEIVNIPECHRAAETNAISHEIDNENGDHRLCVFPDYDPKQIELLIALSKDILARNPDIGPTQIVGHSDIAPSRKNDPGPRFPWFQLYKAGIGAWYDNDTVTRYWHTFLEQKPSIALVQNALRRYGYNVVETGVFDSQTFDVISAFQMHFLPWQVTGEADVKTVATLFALLDKYFNPRLEKLMARYQAEQQPKVVNKTAKPQGQFANIFPTPKPSSRKLVNNRATFKSYKNRGEIIIEPATVAMADIFINGEKINIEQPFIADKRYHYSLKRRTKNGLNTIKVDNVLPEGESLNITIPFPTLERNTQAYSEKFQQLDAFINNEIGEGFPGAVLLVVKNGKVIKHSAYGHARMYQDGGEPMPNPIPMQVDTIFDLASVTKVFATNLALMRLMSEGKVDVNKPIQHYLPLYQGQSRATRLVRDLLTHTAGYAPVVDFHRKDNALGEQFFSQNKQKTQQLLQQKVPFAVGRHTKRMYSDTDYMLLGTLIESIVNQPLDQYLEQSIYAQLNLTSTVFNPLEKGFAKENFAATEIFGNSRGGLVSFDNMRTSVIQGEVHDEKAFYAMQGVAGHAGLFGHASDLAVLVQLMLNNGGYGDVRLFDRTVLDEFIKPDIGDHSYGLGWRRSGDGLIKWHFGPYASPEAYGHTGWTGNAVVIDPKHDLGIILLTNKKHTPIENIEGNVQFLGDSFELGKYGSIVSLVYEAILH